ncbi:hypothetical protein [Paenibacillus naphthalenovorans]|uniref:Uncharacterized protein n=1 Tax=Paenibacillus naphthalenovorans TaxID=162209 RepID=A0A0U2U754_9BACL|nr:hypothetical protein [Paenibacillus naphthalenovorans]ALS22201.1 hypothetical protein IJ22_18270 [Paenibacillus naphthalenovorans]
MVQCEALEDLIYHGWGYDEVVIAQGGIFQAKYYEGDPYVIVNASGFKDGVEFVGLAKVRIINED